jgi:hypothetical protein
LRRRFEPPENAWCFRDLPQWRQVEITDAGGVGRCDYEARRKVVKKVLSQKQRINEMAFRRVWGSGVRGPRAGGWGGARTRESTRPDAASVRGARKLVNAREGPPLPPCGPPPVGRRPGQMIDKRSAQRYELCRES